MSDWILVPYDDQYETWVRVSAIERIYVDKTENIADHECRCRIHFNSKEHICFHFKNIAAIASAAGIGYYGGVSLQPKADEPVLKFKAGDHVYVVGGETGDYIVQGVTLAKPRVHGKLVWICRADGSTPESLSYDACESEMFRTESQAWMEVAARYEGERADAAQRCQDAQGKAAELRSA